VLFLIEKIVLKGLMSKLSRHIDCLNEEKDKIID
jgi:hypothetical protein